MPLPKIEEFVNLVATVVPLCHLLPFLATLYSCLSDRKAFTENPFASPHQLYRKLGLISPFVLRLFSNFSLLLLKALEKKFLFRLVSVDTTFLRRNGTKLPFVKKAYDPLGKRGAVGQVLAIACAHIGSFCLPIGFCIVEGGRKESVISLLSWLPFLPDNLTLLVDGGLMNKGLVEWVRREKKGWELKGVMKRNMTVWYRGKEGRVEEIVKKPRVVWVKRWDCKVFCVPFQRRNGKVYYLACTNTKFPSEKVRRRYLRRVEIEVVIRVLKQEMGIGKRLFRKRG